MKCKRYTSVLSIGFIPMVMLGILSGGLHIFIRGIPHISSFLLYAGIILGLTTGICIHELAHSIYALAFGAELYEVGIMLAPIPGAYVLMDDDMTDSKCKIRILLAGIEANLTIFGLSMFASFICNMPIFAVIGIINIGLAIENALFIPGLDGYEAMRMFLKEKQGTKTHI